MKIEITKDEQTLIIKAIDLYKSQAKRAKATESDPDVIAIRERAYQFAHITQNKIATQEVTK